MRRKQIIVLCFLAVIVMLAWWLLRASKHAPVETPSTPVASVSPSSARAASSASATPEPTNERRQATIASVVSALSTPITFYGKVVDQNGDPVANATAKYNVIDKFDASGSNYQSEADANGNFSITGINGAVLLVGVNKDKYYQIDGKSGGAFAYGVGPDSTRKPPPSKDRPAIFVLHKMGNTVPLVRTEKGTRIPKDGTPVTVDLRSGRVSDSGNFRVEAWTDVPTEGRKFAWRCRVSVLGGGLIERKGQFDFEAPSDGYEESVEIAMPQNAGQWASEQQRSYFVKLHDNHYARINFRMIAGGNHYFILESFLNPTPGDRKLEYDPEKAIQNP